MSLKFSNLPLEDAAVRAYFAPSLVVDFGKLLSIVRRLGDDFEEPIQVPEFEALSGPTQLFDLGYGSIRLSARDHRSVLSIQPNAFVARWRREFRESYPRYDRLKATLGGALDVAETLFGSVAAPHVVNMSYVNVIIPPNTDGNADHLWNYLSADVLPQRCVGKDLHDLNFSWRDTEERDLRIILQRAPIVTPVLTPAGEVINESRPAYMLTTSCGTFVREAAKPLSDLDHVHDALQELFLSLLTDEAKEEWGYAGNA